MKQSQLTYDAKKGVGRKISPKKIVRKFAKLVAYVTIIVLASYGMRQLLKSVDDSVSMVITVIAVLGLVYIIFVDND